MSSSPIDNKAKPPPPPPLTCTRFNNKTWQEYQKWMSANQSIYEQIYQRPLKCIYGCPREITNKKIPPQSKILVIEMNNDENKIQGIGEIQNQTASEVYRSTSGHTSTSIQQPSPLLPPKYNTLFSDRNYTRYIYIGNTRYATREELERNHTEDAQYINEQLIKHLPESHHDHHPESHPHHPPESHDHHPESNHDHPESHHHPVVGGRNPPRNPPRNLPRNPLENLERLLFKGAKHMKRGSGITRCSFIKEQ